MKDEIMEEYQKIQNKISYDQFLDRIKEMKKDYEDVSFMDDLDIARMIVGEFINEENTPLAELEENKMDKISKLEVGAHKITLTGRVMRISNVKNFTTKKGKEGKVANLIVADDTGEIRVVLWTENIKWLKKIEEGNVIKINNAEVKEGFRDKEIHLNIRSTIEKLSKEDFKEFPKYEENITDIADIKGEIQVNVIARISRISRIRTYNNNGREGKFLSLDLMDGTGSISMTLWNKDVELIDELGLREGDSVKILGAQSRVRNGEVNLTHSWIGRILKGEFDVPEYKEKIIKIGDAHEMRDVSVIGVVSKVQDKINFERADGSTGSVRSIMISDDTGSIRVTLWNDDADLEINKGDIMNITGGNIEFDEFSETGYRVNTNWGSRIIVNPETDDSVKKLLDEHKKDLEPVKIQDLNEIEDEGEEIDIVGRILDIYEPNEFQRSDGTTGMVRSVKVADDTGVVRSSFWDDKAELGLKRGDLVRIENARTRFRNDQVELSIGKTARVLLMSDEDVYGVPSIDELEEMMYKPVKIEDLNKIENEGEEIGIIGRIMDIREANEFQRSDGTTGIVRTVEIADDTGVLRASFWDDKAELGLEIGEPIWIKNARTRLRDGNVELSVGRTTMVIKPSPENLESIPSIKDLEKKIYKTKKIDELEEEDSDVRVSGEIVSAYGDRILYEMCPNCNKKIEFIDDTYLCDYCGEEIEDPNYLMIIPIMIEDDTGTIRTTFFRGQAEELIGMTVKEVREVINKTADEGSLAEKVEDLVGGKITIIADARFDDYNEEIRLIARRLIDIKL